MINHTGYRASTFISSKLITKTEYAIQHHNTIVPALAQPGLKDGSCVHNSCYSASLQCCSWSQVNTSPLISPETTADVSFASA